MSTVQVLKDRYYLVLSPKEKSLFRQSLIATVPLIGLYQIEIIRNLVLVLLGIVGFNIVFLAYKYIIILKPPETDRKVEIKRKVELKQEFKGLSSPATIIKSPLKSQRMILSRANIPISPSKEISSRPEIFGGRISLPATFQNGLKPTMSPVKEIIEDGLLFIDAEATLHRWKVTQFIDIWSENMRMVRSI